MSAVTHSGEILLNYKSSSLFRPKNRTSYFLFFMFRIATINDAVVSIIINSSYVLISIILSVRLGADESTSPNYLGKYIMLSLYFKLSKFLVLLHCGSYFRLYRSISSNNSNNSKAFSCPSSFKEL